MGPNLRGSEVGDNFLVLRAGRVGYVKLRPTSTMDGCALRIPAANLPSPIRAVDSLALNAGEVYSIGELELVMASKQYNCVGTSID